MSTQRKPTNTEDAAAIAIQRHYRGHRQRRELAGYRLTPHERWSEALRDASNRRAVQPLPIVTPRGRWSRAVSVAHMAQRDDPDSDSEGEKEVGEVGEKAKKKKRARAEWAKMMDMQYFLEMVDLKHRYGSNLKAYHEYWLQQETTQNFFHWLDHGDGRSVNLPICPRERLDREMVRYLSREERQAYLVTIDAEGRLCWAKNGERIDTTEAYHDSAAGIVPVDASAPPAPPHSSSSASASSLSTTSSSSDRANVYAPPTPHKRPYLHLASPATILTRLLRKTIKKNTWIFVADLSFRLYVGIKQSGAFQHSSFLHGARVAAAGLIKIKDGKLRALSPLSGHYRPSASHFQRFVHSLHEAGVDMHGISISKSYLVLYGLEGWGKMVRGRREVVRKVVGGEKKGVEGEEERMQVRRDTAVAVAEGRPGGKAGRGHGVGAAVRRRLHIGPRKVGEK